jgi:hypothetical protein
MKRNNAPYGSDQWRKLDKEDAVKRAKERGVYWEPPSAMIDKTPSDDEPTGRPHRSDLQTGDKG